MPCIIEKESSFAVATASACEVLTHVVSCDGAGCEETDGVPMCR